MRETWETPEKRAISGGVVNQASDRAEAPPKLNGQPNFKENEAALCPPQHALVILIGACPESPENKRL